VCSCYCYLPAQEAGRPPSRIRTAADLEGATARNRPVAVARMFSAAGGYQWITWCSIKYGQRSWLAFPCAQVPLDDRAACRWQASGQGHAWPAHDGLHAAETVARLQQTQGARIDPVHVTVVGET
jgi:hypothetical protein